MAPIGHRSLCLAQPVLALTAGFRTRLSQPVAGGPLRRHCVTESSHLPPPQLLNIHPPTATSHLPADPPLPPPSTIHCHHPPPATFQLIRHYRHLSPARNPSFVTYHLPPATCATYHPLPVTFQLVPPLPPPPTRYQPPVLPPTRHQPPVPPSVGWCGDGPRRPKLAPWRQLGRQSLVLGTDVLPALGIALSQPAWRRGMQTR